MNWWATLSRPYGTRGAGGDAAGANRDSAVGTAEASRFNGWGGCFPRVLASLIVHPPWDVWCGRRMQRPHVFALNAMRRPGSRRGRTRWFAPTGKSRQGAWEDVCPRFLAYSVLSSGAVRKLLFTLSFFFHARTLKNQESQYSTLYPVTYEDLPAREWVSP